VLGSAVGISVRESDSAVVLGKLLERAGRNEVEVSVVPDYAFLRGYMQTDRPNRIDRGKGKGDYEQPFAVIVPRSRFPEPSSKHIERAYRRGMAEMADFLIEQNGLKVLLMFTALSTGGTAEDDRDVARDILMLMNASDECSLIEEDLKPSEVIAFLRRAELVIGTRLHANIFAVIAGVPFLAIDYFGPKIGALKVACCNNQIFTLEGFTRADTLRRLKRVATLSMDRREPLGSYLKEVRGKASNGVRRDPVFAAWIESILRVTVE